MTEEVQEQQTSDLLPNIQMPGETLYERFAASKGFLYCAAKTLTCHTDYEGGGWLSPEAHMVVPDIEDALAVVDQVLSTWGPEYMKRREAANNDGQ